MAWIDLVRTSEDQLPRGDSEGVMKEMGCVQEGCIRKKKEKDLMTGERERRFSA